MQTRGPLDDLGGAGFRIGRVGFGNGLSYPKLEVSAQLSVRDREGVFAMDELSFKLKSCDRLVCDPDIFTECN